MYPLRMFPIHTFLLYASLTKHLATWKTSQQKNLWFYEYSTLGKRKKYVPLHLSTPIYQLSYTFSHYSFILLCTKPTSFLSIHVKTKGHRLTYLKALISLTQNEQKLAYFYTKMHAINCKSKNSCTNTNKYKMMEVFIVSMVMQRDDDAAEWTLEIPGTPAQSRTPLGPFD